MSSIFRFAAADLFSLDKTSVYQSVSANARGPYGGKGLGHGKARQDEASPSFASKSQP